MKVQEIMKKQAVFCGLDTTLASAVEIMRENGCGFLPVVGEGGNVIGVITDRDICIALGTRNQKPGDITAREVMLLKRCTFPRLFTCTADDDLHSALKTMRMAKVRRLPVIDREGELVGILSMDEIVLQACAHASKHGISCKDVIEAYQDIFQGRRQPPATRRPTAA